MSNDMRRSEQPKTGTYFSDSSLNHNLEQPVASNASSVDDRLDEILVSLSKTMHDRGINHAEAKQQLLSLIAEVIGENDTTSLREISRELPMDEALYWRDRNQSRNFLRAEQRRKLKGVNHE